MLKHFPNSALFSSSDNCGLASYGSYICNFRQLRGSHAKDKHTKSYSSGRGLPLTVKFQLLRMHAEVDNEEGSTILAICKVCVEMYGLMHNVRSKKTYAADLNGVSAERTSV